MVRTFLNIDIKDCRLTFEIWPYRSDSPEQVRYRVQHFDGVFAFCLSTATALTSVRIFFKGLLGCKKRKILLACRGRCVSGSLSLAPS